MSAPVKVNFKIYQGSTFSEVLRWESGTKVYKQIASITKTAPIEISTVVAHEIPEGWRVKITNVGGMKEINSEDTYRVATGVLPGSFQINDVNALGFTTYTSGGVVEYNQPVDLAGYTARMQLREKINSAEVLLELTTANNRVIINNVDKTITLNIDAATTAALNFSTCVYSLELVKGSEVISLASGNISLLQEVTR